MRICLDRENCKFENRDKARFCAQCGLPTQGALLQGRYEIQNVIGKDRTSVTLRAIDHQQEQPVTVRALRPKRVSVQECEDFLQDAELAISFSNHIQDPGSIRVIDYGQDGPVVFLVKSDAVPVAHRVAYPVASNIRRPPLPTS